MGFNDRLPNDNNYGVIADELFKLFPELVTLEDGYQHIRVKQLQFLILGCVVELAKKFTND